MAKLKKKSAICPVMVACDGADLYNTRTMCGKCEERLRRKAKQGQKEANHVSVQAG